MTVGEVLSKWSDKLLPAAGQTSSRRASPWCSTLPLSPCSPSTSPPTSPGSAATFLSWFGPAAQQRLGWTIDQSIAEVGGYFYSRLLLTLINGTRLLRGHGRGRGARRPGHSARRVRRVRLRVHPQRRHLHRCRHPRPAHARRQWPRAGAHRASATRSSTSRSRTTGSARRISAKTMDLNGGLAFGAALAGGALFGPMGAFMALPVAALVCRLHLELPPPA